MRAEGMKGMGFSVGVVLLVAGVVWYGHAGLDAPGFEKAVVMGEWDGPWGHGALGGKGSGSFVDRGTGDFVRTGDRALRLTVGDDGNPDAVAWAGVSQTKACKPGVKVRAGAWLYCNSENSPPTEGRAMAQLRLEYFRDAFAEQIIPTHVTLSTPFTSSVGHAPDTWHLVQVYDRVPDEARTMKFSILLLSQLPNNANKVVWVDDAFLEFQDARAAGPHLGFEGYSR